MIAYIQGKLVHKEPTYAIIDVQGVGYHVNISLYTFGQLKDQEQCKLHTYLHIKEDSHTLYGFSDSEEKKIFLKLISISGVGPSTGLTIQSSLSPQELQQAILGEDVSTIQSVKGVGGKTAQRIILELRDKLKKEELIGTVAGIAPTSRNTLRSEALSALATLGIPKQVAEKSIDAILKSNGNNITLEELIKLALKNS